MIDEQHRPFLLRHEEMGEMTAADVVRIRALDVVHYLWDVRRIVDQR